MPQKALIPKKLGPVRTLRIRKIEEMLFEGNPSIEELAEKFEVSTYVIETDLKHLRDGWLKVDRRKVDRRRSYRVRQYEYLYEQTLEDYNMSGVEIIGHETVMAEKDCHYCNGVGFKGDDFCDECDGMGKFEFEEKKPIFRAKPRDPTHLNIALKALDSIGKLEGLETPVVKKVERKTEESVSIIGTSIKIENNPYKDLPPEEFQKLLSEFHKKKQLTVEGKVVD